MRVLIQRVKSAHVTVDGAEVARIGMGILGFVAIAAADDNRQAQRLAERVLGYRLFPDDAGKMNQSVIQRAGGVLCVPQFTLYADTTRGLRPSFTPAGAPEKAKHLFSVFCEHAEQLYPSVQRGRFGAEMDVTLTNWGPVTFLLEA